MAARRSSFPVGDLGDYVASTSLFGVIAALILLPAVFGEDGGGLVRGRSGTATLGWLGLVSYGIFLWQFPVLIVVLDAGSRPSCRSPCSRSRSPSVARPLSYYLLERPLMRHVRRRRAITEPAAG